MPIRIDWERCDHRINSGFIEIVSQKSFAPVPQQLQEQFRKLLYVGASPTGGSILQLVNWGVSEFVNEIPVTDSLIHH